MFSLLAPLLTCLILPLASASGPGFFINPPNAGNGQVLFFENRVYTIGDDVSLRWNTTLDQYSVWLWQQSPNAGAAVLGQTVFTKIVGSRDPSGFDWTVTAQSFDLKQSDVFFFALGPRQEITANTVTSHYFNLTRTPIRSSTASSVATASTSSVSSTSSLSSTIVTSSTVQTTSSASAATTNATEPNRSGNSNNDTTKPSNLGLELGLGLGLGLPLLAVSVYLAVKCAMKRRTRSEIERHNPPVMMGPTHNETKWPTSPQEVYGDSYYRTWEQRSTDRKHSYHNGIAELSSGTFPPGRR